MNELPTDSHRVTAILVVHDGATWLPEVVASLASQSRSIDLTLAVDTGSVDSSAKLLKNARLKSITLPRETGFGEAVAAGLAELTPSESENEWLWLIHDDCAPQPGALAALLAAVADRPQVAMAGPKLLGWYDRSHLLEVGISISSNGARWTGLEPHEYDQGQHDGIRDVLAVSTAGALIRRSVFAELGGFDPNLNLFRDDVDFGWRVNVAGHSVIAVSEAVAFHAAASTSERRSVDVKGALLNRPLLLDRRNAAFVLLANSPWWILPWLTLQLVASAAFRAIGYLLAKLPGYASDEFLAVALLLVHPAQIWEGRKRRREERLISARTVNRFIPPRWSQMRMAALRATQSIRQRLLPNLAESSNLLDQLNEDEDLLTPTSRRRWWSAFRRPEIAGVLLLLVVCSIWASQRYGSLTGGSLSVSPNGAIDLWQKYGESWHQVGMGSSDAAPPWLAVLALLSTLFFGKAAALLAVLFWLSPLLMAFSMRSLLRRFSQNSWLLMGASLAYSFSPVAIATVNSGRLGTLAALILAPQIARFIPRFIAVEEVNWRLIFGFALLTSVLTSFTLLGYLGIALILFSYLFRDLLQYRQTLNRQLLTKRLQRWAVLILTPFLLCLPWSLAALVHPVRFILEPGILLDGGTSNLVLLGNPGGPGSLPWWILSPVTFMVFIAAFSSGKVRRYANFGIAYLLSAAFLSLVSIAGHGTSANVRVWTGTLLTFATVAALCSGVIILDGLRQRLADVHFHYRHVLGGLIVAATLFSGLGAMGWIAAVGYNSVVQANRSPILPPFLTLTPGTKILVLRNLEVGNVDAPSYFIARASDVSIGDPDVAPENSPAIESAVRDISDGSGINSSHILASYGIKYLYMANPVSSQLVRAVDGLGGFARTSSTQAGIVWQVAGISDRLVFTSLTGTSQAMATLEVSANGETPKAGVLTLAENYDSSWQVIQAAKRLDRQKNAYGLPEFQSKQAGDFILIHDGTKRRAWLSLQLLLFLGALIMSLPSGRRRSQISTQELT